MAKSADAAVAQWFSQDIFDDENIEDPDEDAEEVVRHKRQQRGAAAAQQAAAAEEEEEEEEEDGQPERGGSGDEQPPAGAEQQSGSEGGEPSSGSDAEGEPGTAAARRRQQRGAAAGAAAYGLSADALAGPADGDGFEVVPAQESGEESESEDEFELMDDEAKVGGVGGCWPLGCACFDKGLMVVLAAGSSSQPAVASRPSLPSCPSLLTPLCRLPPPPSRPRCAPWPRRCCAARSRTTSSRPPTTDTHCERTCLLLAAAYRLLAGVASWCRR